MATKKASKKVKAPGRAKAARGSVKGQRRVSVAKRSSNAKSLPSAPAEDDVTATKLVPAAGGSSRGRRNPPNGVNPGSNVPLADEISGDGVLAKPDRHRIDDAVTGLFTGSTAGEDLLIAEIREMHKRRQAWHRAEKALILQIKAIERRLRPAEDSLSAPTPTVSDEGDSSSVAGSPSTDGTPTDGVTPGDRGDMDTVVFYATFPLTQARDYVHKFRIAAERRCQKLAMALPLYRMFVEPINGFGALGFAQIIGEAGKLTNYSTPAKLWKRMGVAVINGERQRRVTGAEALEHGYAPERRSILWNIGDALLKKQNEYKVIYDTRKAMEAQKAATEGLTVAPQAEIDKVPKDQRDKYRSAGHIHARAKRYAEKRLLRNLWRAARAIQQHEPAEKIQATGT